MGPLAGISVVEFAGIGPTPFVALLLSDLGADVITIDRVPSADGGTPDDLVRMTTGGLGRGRRSVAVDLKSPDGIDTVLELLKNADGLIEGYRPGVMERLGLGPEVCLARNPRLVFGRMTGWGQDGDLAQRAGHDLNYIAVAGVLHHIGGRDQAPTVPLNLIGDFGGGGLLLAFGMVAAMLEARNSGQGQVVDASMAEGSALLMTMMYELSGRGMWDHDRESNMNDGGAHFYSVYATSDDKYVAVAAMEPKFYANLLSALGLDGRDLPDQWDRSQWPALREVFAEVFRTRTRDAWTALLEDTDSCVTPVLSMLEAPSHRHNVSRNAFVKVDDITQPAPAPRFSRTPTQVRRGVAEPGQHSVEVLREAGIDEARIDALLASGSIASTDQEVKV
ncbi:CaiB/BaiF CoA transferase family protein [Rhodococcus sp. NPDC127530]|uniref:CaiB/BaiF CoA transferase family protein n=1 Tax=unclassified Rhodococcus (in: high G+C Gram-positive bacteria) TaxID=192944 RepID=UPI00362CF664